LPDILCNFQEIFFLVLAYLDSPSCPGYITSMDIAELYTTAELAQIKLEDSEVESLAGEVSQMVSYFEKMMEVSVDTLEPTTHAFIKKNRLRPDTYNPSTLADDILEQSPDLEDRFICIPNVL